MSWFERRAFVKIFGGGKLGRLVVVRWIRGALLTGVSRFPRMSRRSARGVLRGVPLYRMLLCVPRSFLERAKVKEGLIEGKAEVISLLDLLGVR